MTEHVVFALVEDFSHLAFANAVEPLRIANMVSGKELYRWSFLSQDGHAAKASSGAATLVHGDFAGGGGVLDADRLFVVSGNNVRDHVSRSLLALLRRERRRGMKIGAICSGAYVLAAAGMLNGRRAAVHWTLHDTFGEDFPQVELSKSIFVAEDGFATASGGAAAADLMLHFIEATHGEDVAIRVADQMVYTAVRDESARQTVSVQSTFGRRNAKLNAAIRVMRDTLETPIQTPDLAARVGISTRQLERLFGSHLGTSPQSYYRRLRMDRAQRLLLQTDMSVMQVAVSCGYGSTTHFARHYKGAFGVSPSKQRFRMCEARH
ncbi:transcriptional regulator, AraC family with amidase-like domain [Pseudooceanicola nitratireducens]|jgi:transcriptional regulator GlxA family with amidase domain|uniref:Transcriptional regulator, AraC family with amidase-like domain n=1 Tax=Pseudooceanicola nitratireducens TaxID=517719 RepID=A0A1I1K4Y6_9RHOB|nr:GlxA family transcriptional regulator [Pseudooceanicola nitratireducens]SEJ50416.1 Transcriptional regulator GlxA family, contains an amidase domain and an AraC-type DNA-binding HTH domain [Pseudooceanicola nitratireducens]SFC53798.1 transcriptional regulator, AraC family with amidase-like domain [Pseudooceanicola nitratireducens]